MKLATRRGGSYSLSTQISAVIFIAFVCIFFLGSIAFDRSTDEDRRRLKHKHHHKMERGDLHIKRLNMYHDSAESSFAKRDKKPLMSLYTEEVVLLLEALHVYNCAAVVRHNFLEGVNLMEVDNALELQELGITIPTPAANEVYQKIASFKTDGVPILLIEPKRPELLRGIEKDTTEPEYKCPEFKPPEPQPKAGVLGSSAARPTKATEGDNTIPFHTTKSLGSAVKTQTPAMAQAQSLSHKNLSESGVSSTSATNELGVPLRSMGHATKSGDIALHSNAPDKQEVSVMDKFKALQSGGSSQGNGDVSNDKKNTESTGTNDGAAHSSVAPIQNHEKIRTGDVKIKSGPVVVKDQHGNLVAF